MVKFGYYSRFMALAVASVILFAIIYMSLGHEHFNGLDGDDNLMSYLYYSATTQSTVGYGDITPRTQLARLLSTCQIFGTIIFIVLGISKESK